MKQKRRPRLLKTLFLFRFFNEIGIIEQLSRNAFERVMPGGMKLSQFTVLNHFVRPSAVCVAPRNSPAHFR